MTVRSNDGGANYQPGTSKAGVNDRPDGKKETRSYGSMTYALLKCYLFAGLPAEDPRVKDAVAWIGKNYTFEENPGFRTGPEGQQGLYYYYQTLAKSLDTLQINEIEDASGRTHDWRSDLTAELLKRQNENGSWAALPRAATRTPAATTWRHPSLAAGRSPSASPAPPASAAPDAT